MVYGLTENKVPSHVFLYMVLVFSGAKVNVILQSSGGSSACTGLSYIYMADEGNSVAIVLCEFHMTT